MKIGKKMNQKLLWPLNNFVKKKKIEWIKTLIFFFRFNLLGEKVSQVPRPSLSAYLRKANVTEKCSLHQLALLYDALSKDARKQGFAKFSGYSDEVLKTLASSAEGGLGPQLQKILEKTIEKNNYSREDAKAKTRLTLNELKNPGSSVNKDLRQLIPLKFNP